METKVQLKNLYLIAVIAVGLIGLGVGSTFAMFTAQASIDNPIAFNSNLSSTNNLSETIEVTVPAGKDKYVDIVISNTSAESLNYSTWYSPSSNSLEVGSTSSNNSYGPVGTLPTATNFTLTVGLRNNGDTPITVTIGVSSSGSSVILPNGATSVPASELPQILTATEYITNLYTEATKSPATVNSITYNLAPSVNLMNDRHASMSTGADAGDIRYYGANPNNYVWLGDTFTTDYTYTSNGESLTRTAGSKKLWRVIGVFDGRIKLIAADPISTQYLSWDTTENTTGGNSGTGINQWGPSGTYEGADLMRLLNEGYTGTNGSLYWNKSIGTVYTGSNNATTADISFANTGLSASEKNLIDSVTWYLGAQDASINNGTAVYTDMQYAAERQSSTLGKICSDGSYCNDEVVRTSTWNGKVGLMYPSDYGYAVDLSQCTNRLVGFNIYPGDSSGYDNTNCKTNNWLYNSSYRQWTMSPRAISDGARLVFDVSTVGYLYSDFAGYNLAGSNHVVRPAVFLKSGVTISSGNGSESNPFVLG